MSKFYLKQLVASKRTTNQAQSPIAASSMKVEITSKLLMTSSIATKRYLVSNILLKPMINKTQDHATQNKSTRLRCQRGIPWKLFHAKKQLATISLT